jgi:histidinol-phosphatase (PHP family)
MILAPHFINNEVGELYSGRPSPSVERLVKYCDQHIQALETGLFTYMAHPDMLNFEGDQVLYEQHMRRLCKAAKACDVPLEINLLGVAEGRVYPNERFWRIAAEEGCQAVLGCDAHNPGMVPNPQAEAKALEMVKKYQITLLDTVPLRPIG